MEQNLVKQDRYHHIKTKSGRVLRVVREHYLREDISCNSGICLSGCGQIGSFDASDVTHYLFPDGRVCTAFMEVLEIDDLKGIVFTQTSVNYVLNVGGRRTLRRLSNKVKDSRYGCIVFANEFCNYAFIDRSHGESLEEWQTMLVHNAAVWYYHHLAGQKDIVMLTENKQMIDKLTNQTSGVHVMTLRNYLTMFWPNLTEANDMFESLQASLSLAAQKGANKQYGDHLPQDILMMRIKSSDQYFEGILNVNKHHAQQEAFVQQQGLGQKGLNLDSDILISGMVHRNRAIHGDRVVVELLARSQWIGQITSLKQDDESEANDQESNTLPTGRVVGIIQRNWRDYVATIQKDEDSSSQGNKTEAVLVIPWNYRIPKIRITTSQITKLKNLRIIVRIDSWEANSQYPNGHFVRQLGPIGDFETEIATILVEHGISVGDFSERQQQELPTNSIENPWQMTDDEIKERLDLRDLLIFSIDPKGCEDVDDTLSIRELENGELELGVHIADVCHFVKPDSLNDLEARQRSTTVYLADRRYDMLPAILSADLCSLISGVDRYAVSVIWHLNPQSYEVTHIWYGRTVIRSAHKMFYEAAQALHCGKDVKDDISELKCLDHLSVEKRLEDLKWCVDKIMDIARHLKAKRIKGGAVQLESTEVKVELNEEQEIEDLVPKQTMEIHETIAECMIFANHWVAKKIVDCYPNCALLRHHPLPRQDHFHQLIQSAKAKGFEVDTSTNKRLADSLDKCVDPDDLSVNHMLRSLATQAMSNALYFSTGSLPRDQFFHYGLGLDRYTHFTSPIRRYADVIVHRLLIAAVNQDNHQCLLFNKDLEELCGHINDKHRASQRAQEDSQVLFQAMFFKNTDSDTSCCIVDAIIQSIRTNGFLVFIPRYGMKGAVYLKDKDGLVCDVTDKGKAKWLAGSLSKSDFTVTVTTLSGKTTYKLFDHVTVRISVQHSHTHSQSMRYELVTNELHEPTCMSQGNSTLRTDIIQEVTSTVSEMKMVDTDSQEASTFHQHKKQFGQSHSKMYQVLNCLRTMALEECT